MQELMSRHKTYNLSPRDCLKTCLFQKWQRMVAPPGRNIESMHILQQTTCPNVCSPMLDGKIEFWCIGSASTANNSQITYENVHWGQPSQWRSQGALYKKVLEIVLQDLHFLLKSVFMELLVDGSVYTTAKVAKICCVCLSFTCEWCPGCLLLKMGSRIKSYHHCLHLHVKR